MGVVPIREQKICFRVLFLLVFFTSKLASLGGVIDMALWLVECRFMGEWFRARLLQPVFCHDHEAADLIDSIIPKKSRDVI